MAEREGFEPSVELPLRKFSKLVLSATQPSLRSVATPLKYHLPRFFSSRKTQRPSFFSQISPFRNKVRKWMRETGKSPTKQLLLPMNAVVFLSERFKLKSGGLPLALNGFEPFFERGKFAVDFGEVDLHPAGKLRQQHLAALRAFVEFPFEPRYVLLRLFQIARQRLTRLRPGTAAVARKITAFAS